MRYARLMLSALLIILATTPPSIAPGLRVSWQAPLDGGSGDLRVDRTGELWVVQAQGGESVALSMATGARRATLVNAAGPIDRYSRASRLVRGALIGPSKLQLVAVDVLTGKVRWKRTVGGLDPIQDDHALRDWLSIVEAGSLDVIAFRHAAPRDEAGDGLRWRFTIAGINAASGKEVWRREVRLADGVVPGWEDAVTLFADGQQVLALAPGRLDALDARTGTPAWSYEWKGSQRPELAWAPGRVALHEHGAAATRILDTATGRELALLPQSGGKVEALGWIANDLCVVSSRDRGAEAACMAVVDGSARELWRRSFEQAPTQVLWDARRLFVALGEERLLALDGQSGHPLWEVTLPRPVRFWIAQDPKGDGQLFAFASGQLLALEREETPTTVLPPYLRYALAEEPGGACQTKAVEWVDGNGQVLWSRPPPASPGPARPCASGEILNYQRAPRHQTLPGYWHLEAAGAVWIFTGPHLQGIDVKTGELLFETRLDSSSPLKQPSFFVDDGSFVYGRCQGKAPRGLVFTVCNQELIVFNGLTALVVDLSSRREKARNLFSESHGRFGARVARVSAQIPLGARKLELEGIIFMR